MRVAPLMFGACLVSGFLLLSAAVALAQTDDTLNQALARVSEEAAVFARVGPQIIGHETLHQKALKPPSRFHPRVGSGTQIATPQYREREIVSEYGFAAFKDSPETIHEFRSVISVDGVSKATKEKARDTLTMGLTSKDDQLRKRMLRDFERNGLVGAAMDFGQMLLLFNRRNLKNFTFTLGGTARVGADPAIIVSYRQNEGQQALKIFERNRMIVKSIQGELWLRQSDYLPLKITLTATHPDGAVNVDEDASVEYSMSAYGVVLPAAVVYRQIVVGTPVVENLFTYSAYKKFSADAEIKFAPQEKPNPPE